MKKKISIITLSLISFVVPNWNAVGQGTSDSDLEKVVSAVIDIVTIVDKNCDNLRENDALQKRCKNLECVTVSCISFRKACANADDCK